MDHGTGVPAAAAAVNAQLNGAAPPPFLSKTYDMVDDPACDAVVSWSPANNSFVVWNPPEFARDLLPKYFKHNNFSSFVRQLNTYGFRKVDPDRWEFANEGFLRGQKHLLRTITRRKPTHVPNQPLQAQAQTNPVGACVEVGKFGLEEEIERLKRDKNILMQELVRLRQQQQATDHELQTLGQRLQGMEQRQQQMMTFLAKAMQSPVFLKQLVQQQNDSNRRIIAVNRKRRLPKQESKLNSGNASPDGQIIKYQPLMNEAAEAMLRQILKLETPRLEPFGSENFFFDNFPSLGALDSISNSSRNSGVSLAVVPTSSGISQLSSGSGFSEISSSALPEIQSSAGLADMTTTAEIPNMSMLSGGQEAVSPSQPGISIPEFSQMHNMSMLSGVQEAISPSQPGINIPDFSEMPGMVISNSPVDIPKNFLVPDAGSVYADPMSGVVDGPLSIGSEDFVTDTDIDLSVDDGQHLPGINDVFWEQFLTTPLPGDAEEAESGTMEAKDTQPEIENGWQNAQNMHSLTEQMGLLSSEGKL